MDRTGMHWRLPGSRAMLKTRALHLNSEWDDFVELPDEEKAGLKLLGVKVTERLRFEKPTVYVQEIVAS